MSFDKKNKEDSARRKYSLDERHYDENGNEIKPDDRLPVNYLSRVAAFFIDSAILTIPYLLCNLFLNLIFGFTTHSLLATLVEMLFAKFNLLEAKTAVALTVFASVIAWFLITLLFGIVYHTLLEILQGASYGKKLLGIKVLNAKGFEAHPVQLFERNIYKIISLVAFGAGFLVPIFSLRKESLHDLLSNTRVVRDLSVENEQIVAGQCFGFAMAIGLYLTFVNEQATLDQLKPLLPSTELSDRISLKLDTHFETPKIPVAAPDVQKKLVQKLLKSTVSTGASNKAESLESGLDQVGALGEVNTEGENISLDSLSLESNENKIGSKNENGLVNALESIKDLKSSRKTIVGSIKTLNKEWKINGVYARVNNLEVNTKKWSITLHFFRDKLKEKDYNILNKTVDPNKDNPLKNNPLLLSFSIGYLNKTIICQRSDYTHGIIHLSKILREEIFNKTGIYPDLTLAINEETLREQKLFKASCLPTYMQSNIDSTLKGSVRLSNNTYTEIEWDLKPYTLLYEYLVNIKKFYEGTEYSFSLWNPGLNLLKIVNLNQELTKQEIIEIYRNQNFSSVKNKVNVLISIEVDRNIVRLNTDSIENGYKLTFFKNTKNSFKKDWIVKKKKYQLPKMLSGMLTQGSTIVGRFKGVHNFKKENGEILKLKWTIPIDSKVLVIK